MKIYYAHSVSLYGKPQEERDVAMLQAMGFEVVNPNSPEHAAGYKQSGMDYFTGVLEQCDAIAFRAHADGSIPAGVIFEISVMRHQLRPVIELPSAIGRRALTVDQTRDYLREVGLR